MYSYLPRLFFILRKNTLICFQWCLLILKYSDSVIQQWHDTASKSTAWNRERSVVWFLNEQLWFLFFLCDQYSPISKEYIFWACFVNQKYTVRPVLNEMTLMSLQFFVNHTYSATSAIKFLNKSLLWNCLFSECSSTASVAQFWSNPSFKPVLNQKYTAQAVQSGSRMKLLLWVGSF